jgi:hypothetical protein
MTTRGEEFLGCLGNGKSDRELDNELEDLECDELDEELEEEIKTQNIIYKEELKNGRTKKQ